jgi:hypothetical protein
MSGDGGMLIRRTDRLPLGRARRRAIATAGRRLRPLPPLAATLEERHRPRFLLTGPRLPPYTQWHLPGGSTFKWAMTDDPHPIHLSAEGLERVAALRLSGLPLATFLALLARLDSTGRAKITQPELCKLLSTGGGKVWQSLQTLVAAGVIEPPVERSGFGRRTAYRIPADLAGAPSVPPRRRGR